MTDGLSRGKPNSRCRLAILVDTDEQRGWMVAFRFDDFDVDPLPFHSGVIGGEQSTETIPDFANLLTSLRRDRPDACLALGGGVPARLLSIACQVEGIPLFSLVATDEEFAQLPIADSVPAFYFIASSRLLARALPDDRYGLTVFPTGHPARDLADRGPLDSRFSGTEFGDGRAADRILAIIREWRRGELDQRHPELSVVIPAFREAKNLPMVCDRLIDVFSRQNIACEILLIDDASPDDTYEVAIRQMWKSPRIRAFTKPTPRGMGNAIRHGIARARADVVAITMGDGSDEVEQIPGMYQKVAEGYALVIGSRYRRPENYENIPLLYQFWSRCFRLTAWAMLGVRLEDYTNAFRVFSRRIFARYGLESGGFEISPEITFKAWFSTRRIAEFDVRHLKRASGQSKFSFLRAGPGYGKILIKAFVNRLTGRWFTLDW